MATDALYLTPGELHVRLKCSISVRTLANWRYLGVGPKFTRAGGRILYPLAEVERWEAQQTVDSTSKYSRSA